MSARILTVTPDAYHADPCARPSLNATTAKALIGSSPLHAWHQHPRLGGCRTVATKAMDEGSLIHSLLLDGGTGLRAIVAPDYRTKAAQQSRDEAREKGLTPVLVQHLAEAKFVSIQWANQLEERGILLNDGGSSGLVVEWEEPSAHGPVLCRCMFDHCWMDQGRFLELKSTADASPSGCERTTYSLGYDIQIAAYTRALEAVRPALVGRVQSLLAFAEPDPPYPLSVYEPDGVFRELGMRRWRSAVERWAECLTTNQWPGYQPTNAVGLLSVPGWVAARELHEYEV